MDHTPSKKLEVSETEGEPTVPGQAPADNPALHQQESKIAERARHAACHLARSQLDTVARDLELGDSGDQDRFQASELRLVGAIIIVVALLSVEFFNWTEFTFISPDSVWWWLPLALAVAAMVGLWVQMFLSNRNGEKRTESIGASLFRVSPIMIGMAGTVMVGLYLWPLDDYTFFNGWEHHAAVLGGVIAALAIGGIVAMCTTDLTGPKSVHHRIYGELAAIHQGCVATVESYCPSGISNEPRSVTSGQQVDLRSKNCSEPTPRLPHRVSARWVLGTGYIDMWNRLHAVEEALFLIKPRADVASDGLSDEMRLKDSNIYNSADYGGKLRFAIEVLGGGDYLSTPPQRREPNIDDRCEDPETQARMVMRGVRHTINQYRDSRREGLVRTRNNLMTTGTVTGVFALLILGLAIFRRIEDSTLVAGIAFYLVGAIVGLFNQLNSGWGKAGETEEDYGLTHARLMYTPILSGLAAIGGVLIVSFLSATLLTTSPDEVNGETGPQTEATPAAGEGQGSQTRYARVPTLGEVFSLEDGQFGLVTAAIFGLTPGLLVQRLKSEGEQYKADLQSTGAQGNR